MALTLRAVGGDDPIIAPNHAVAVAMAVGPRADLRLLYARVAHLPSGPLPGMPVVPHREPARTRIDRAAPFPAVCTEVACPAVELRVMVPVGMILRCDRNLFWSNTFQLPQVY
ncbi:hypothetical protein [Nocardia amikacinitolerans]|uniref:hypothetical protein n=1 Tax=Nocardia amikacinitolerans TaxID=756689 RepID=UPI000BE48CC7|nr:hypothetical protein [Nocardia amikacinitolerans]